MKKPEDKIKSDPKCKSHIAGHCGLTIDREHHTKLVQPCVSGSAYCRKEKS